MIARRKPVPPSRERALVVGLSLPGRSRWDLEDALEELARLVSSAGAEVVATSLQRRPKPDPATLIGAGKVRELEALIREHGAGTVVFEHGLSPGQERNLSRELGAKVLDRADLILDIFAQRALTREGKLQVEVAQLTRMLPRLVGRGQELSRLGGGIGTRGPGETRLESDRRRVRRRLALLKARIRDLGRHRALYQRKRRRAPVPVASLVGYTNAGKSTLLNALSGSRVRIENRLFSTLDPTSRRVRLPTGEPFVLTDTVGFIRHIPPQLVSAFTATLGELREADLLLHVIDASSPVHEEQRESVLQFLSELGLADRPRLEIYNKADRLSPADPFRRSLSSRGAPVLVSARDGDGLDALRERIGSALAAAGAIPRRSSARGRPRD